MALEERAAAQISQRDDLASQIKLQVRSAWLTGQETLRRIPVARAAISQAEENLRVARGRYIQQRGTNTEVIDAETSRVQSYDNYYNALYDALLADFELRARSATFDPDLITSDSLGRALARNHDQAECATPYWILGHDSRSAVSQAHFPWWTARSANYLGVKSIRAVSATNPNPILPGGRS